MLLFRKTHKYIPGACFKVGFRFYVVACLKRSEAIPLLKIVMVVLVLLWVLGFVTHHTMGGFLHALLVLAAVLWLIRVVRGGNP